MATLELSADDGVLLREILESCLGDLRMEIANTDRQDFREMLKRREILLKTLIARL